MNIGTLLRKCRNEHKLTLKAVGVNAGDLISQASQQEKSILIKKSEWHDIDLSRTGFVTRRFFANTSDATSFVLWVGTL